MHRRLQSVVSNTLENISQVHDDVILFWLHEFVLSVDGHLETWEAESCQQREEATVCVLRRHQLIVR